jgi:hypothetical protein
VIVISSGDQPPEQIAAHRMLAERSANGRHVIAARSTHWVQFDEPAQVVSLVRELVNEQHDSARAFCDRAGVLLGDDDSHAGTSS